MESLALCTVLYQDECGLCRGYRDFVSERQRAADSIAFVDIASDDGRQILTEHHIHSDPTNPTSLVVLDESGIYFRFSACLRIGKNMRAPWRQIALMGWVVPGFIGNAIYAIISKNRFLISRYLFGSK